MNDQEIRRQLHELAERYGEAEDLRAEVRRRLETLDSAPSVTLAGNEPHPVAGRRWLVAAATVAVVGAGLAAFVLGGRADSDRLAVDSSDVSTTGSAPNAPAETIVVPLGDREQYVSSLTTPAVVFDVPAGAGLAVQLSAESEVLVEFSIESPDVANGHLAVVVPSASDVESAEAVIEWLRSSLSQAELVATDEVVIGGRSVTRVRLGSVVDMTLTGFRLGPRTFVSASGVDRSYEAYIASRPDGGVLIVWIDAVRAEIDAVRPIAGVVIDSLEDRS